MLKQSGNIIGSEYWVDVYVSSSAYLVAEVPV